MTMWCMKNSEEVKGIEKELEEYLSFREGEYSNIENYADNLLILKLFHDEHL